jgi:glycosyltransferase involved in cell wall biosynthesis
MINASNKKITIVIPSYNQTNLLRRCLLSLTHQTSQDFVIYIVDDHSTENYPALIEEFPQLEIKYFRNEKNLGAIENIFNTIIYNVETPYKISLHEDDILHYDYIRKAIEILDSDNEIMFVGTSIDWFKNETELAQKISNSPKKFTSSYKKINAQEFAIELLRGIHFSLGSVVYRSEATFGHTFDLPTYSVLCDRPFLIDVMGDKKIVVTPEKGIFVRNHGALDNRGNNITVQNVCNLFKFYKKYVQTSIEKKIFDIHATNNILYCYHRLYAPNLDFINYIKFMNSEKLINIMTLRPQGVLGLIRGFLKK